MGRKSRFSDEQIVLILKEAQTSGQTGEVGRRHGITTKTFYRWREKCGDMGQALGVASSSPPVPQHATAAD